MTTRGCFILQNVRDEQLNGTWLSSSGGASLGSGVGGYLGGGTLTLDNWASSIVKIVFATDTDTAAVTTNLSQGRWGHTGAGNATDGWFAGGTSGSGVVSSTVDRLIFASDTVACVAKTPLTSTRYGLAAASNITAGWFTCGFTTVRVSTVNKITWATDTGAISTTSAMPTALTLASGAGNASYGYFAAGSLSNVVCISDIARINYSNDTTSTIAINAVLEKHSGAAVANTTDAWFAGGYLQQDDGVGGYNVGYLDTVERFTFATDTSACVTKGPLYVARRNLTGTDNSSTDGWFGGGWYTTGGLVYVSTVDRILFSTDTITASNRGPMSATRYSAAGV